MNSYVLSLSQLLNLVQEVVDAQFYGQSFWVKCEVTDVKKYEFKNWCFCKLLEKKAGQITAESQAVFWQQGYQHLRRFEHATGRKFENGIEISALVQVKFTAKYGFKLEIQELDISFALGQMELARQETINKLLTQYPGQIIQAEDHFITPNNQIPLPHIIQRVALVTANHSDGQRDFLQELTHNRLGYQFRVTGFYTTIQGEAAPALLVKQLEQIAQKAHLFDVVAMVRGGGSQTDLKPFDDYELSRTVALFPLPILTGIGHDRNTSITDLMARQYKVPTKVAAAIVEHNLLAEQDLMQLAERMDDSISALLFEKQSMLNSWSQQMQYALPNRLALNKQRLQQWEQLLQAGSTRILQYHISGISKWHTRLETANLRYLRSIKNRIAQQERLVEQLSPLTVLKRGFAIAEQGGKIITDASQLDLKMPLTTRLAKASIKSNILKIETNE